MTPSISPTVHRWRDLNNEGRIARKRDQVVIEVLFLVSTDSSLDQSELVAELLKELSNHNERVEERKAALCELLKLIRENTLQVWDEHFKTILLLLLETMGDREVEAHFL